MYRFSYRLCFFGVLKRIFFVLFERLSELLLTKDENGCKICVSVLRIEGNNKKLLKKRKSGMVVVIVRILVIVFCIYMYVSINLLFQ